MSLHPETYTPAAQVALQLKQMADRIRVLEGRQSALPLAVAPATPQTTTSATAVPLWLMTGVFPDGWQITITVRLGFDTDDARGSVELRDAAGRTIAAGGGMDGAIVTLTTLNSAFPLILYGHVDTGTMFTTISAAQAAPWTVT